MAKLTKNSTSTKYFSSRQEDYIANLLNGKVQAGSGATAFNKGDIILDDWLIECKTSMKPKSSFSIKKEWIEKNELERLEMHKSYSALVFQFEPEDTNYFVINENTFKKILDMLPKD